MTYSEFFRYGDLLRYFYANSISGEEYPYELEASTMSPDYMRYVLDVLDYAQNI